MKILRFCAVLNIILFGFGCAKTKVAVAPNPANDASEEQTKAIQKSNDKPIPCFNDADCMPTVPFCADFDRHGRQIWNYQEANAYRPWDRLCVSECQSDKQCTKNFRCLGKVETANQALEADGLMRMKTQEHRICAPVPIYGKTLMGESCQDDANCVEAAPFCVRNRCVQRCPDCPPGYDCQSIEYQRLKGKISSMSICLPTK
jgi:hypothetical protein